MLIKRGMFNVYFLFPPISVKVRPPQSHKVRGMQYDAILAACSDQYGTKVESVRNTAATGATVSLIAALFDVNTVTRIFSLFFYCFFLSSQLYE